MIKENKMDTEIKYTNAMIMLNANQNFEEEGTNPFQIGFKVTDMPLVAGEHYCTESYVRLNKEHPEVKIIIHEFILGAYQAKALDDFMLTSYEDGSIEVDIIVERFLCNSEIEFHGINITDEHMVIEEPVVFTVKFYNTNWESEEDARIPDTLVGNVEYYEEDNIWLWLIPKFHTDLQHIILTIQSEFENSYLLISPYLDVIVDLNLDIFKYDLSRYDNIRSNDNIKKLFDSMVSQ